MAVYYLDTAAIVKRYRPEEGTEVVDELLEHPLPGDRFYISLFSLLELTSAIKRLVKDGDLTEHMGNEVLARFSREKGPLFRVLTLDYVIIEAALVVQQYGLRSGDAIHLATAAIILRRVIGVEALLVSSDHELLDAAKAHGIDTLDPQDARALETLHQIRSSGH